VDGELVAVDAEGRPDLARLLRRHGRLAGMLIEAAAGKVDWTAYPDQAAEELKALIDAKRPRVGRRASW